MAKVESRCVLVPSSSVSLACIVGYLSSNRERERDGKSPSLFQTANVMTFFLYLLILGNENYVRDYYSLEEDRKSRRNFPIMFEQGQLAIASYARRLLSILDLSNGRSIQRTAGGNVNDARTSRAAYCVTGRGKRYNEREAYSFAGRHSCSANPAQ